MDYQDEDYRKTLSRELQSFSESGVHFSVNGREVRPDEGLVDMLLAEDDCTYMRNYKFRGGRIAAIEFDKISLK